MPDPITVPAASDTLGPAAKKYYFNADSGILYSDDGWGGVKQYNASYEINSLAEKLAKDYGVTKDEAMAFAKQKANEYYSKPNAQPGTLFGGFGTDVFGDPAYETYKKQFQGEYDKLQAGKQTPEQIEQKSLTGRIDEFINAMKGPVDPNDPVLQGLQKYGAAAANRSLANAGIGMRGGAAARQMNSVTQANILPYLQKRQEMWQTGLGLQSQHDLGLGQLQQGWQQMQNQQAEMRAAAEQAKATSMGQLVGGIAGAIPGAILAPYTGGASLGLISAGSAIGGGISGSGVGAPKYTQRPNGGFNPYTGS